MAPEQGSLQLNFPQLVLSMPVDLDVLELLAARLPELITSITAIVAEHRDDTVVADLERRFNES